MPVTVVILLILLAASAFFSAAETAIMSLGRLRAHILTEQGNSAGRILEDLLADPNRLLSTILIGNNIVNIAASAIATAVAINKYGSAGTGIAAVIVTIAVLVFGEILPKSIAANSTDKVALLLARPVYFISILFRPVVTVFAGFTRLVLRVVGGPAEAAGIVTAEEIRSLITIGHQQGVLEPAEEEILHSVFEFRDTVASEVMTPRLDVPAVEVNDSVDTAAACILENGVTRLAAYEATPDNLVGVVHIEDVLRAEVEGSAERVKDLVRTALVVPESKSVGDLFEQMRKQRVSSAIVADEYGSSAGLINLEDLVEHLVGDLYDEHDPADERIQAVDENSTLVDGRLSIDEINEALDTHLSEENAHTLGGWIFDTLGRLPKAGDIVHSDDVEFKVESMDHWRVDRVRIRKLQKSSALPIDHR